jgi:hypothetical protein
VDADLLQGDDPLLMIALFAHQLINISTGDGILMLKIQIAGAVRATAPKIHGLYLRPQTIEVQRFCFDRPGTLNRLFAALTTLAPAQEAAVAHSGPFAHSPILFRPSTQAALADPQLPAQYVGCIAFFRVKLHGPEFKLSSEQFALRPRLGPALRFACHR